MLTQIAHQLGIRPLREFSSFSLAEAAVMFGEDFIEVLEAQGELRGERWFYQGNYFCSVGTEWFSASDGLKTVNALLEHLRTDSACLGEEIEDEEVEGVELALVDIQELLRDAGSKQRRFHMTSA